MWRAIFLITMATVLGKILEKESPPIPKPEELWTPAKDSCFRALLGKQKCRWRVERNEYNNIVILALRPENIDTFQKSFKDTLLEHSAIAKEVIDWLCKSSDNFVTFRR
jgi:hypothetical protein